ncbi:TfoX/Sxy family protein [Sunxiuqinia sp. A32]|uniref:TfoX/Sxy family protein n=1 Tax=Sunxiuqinia sp. A32 TaxID=3461496 RepID=UPI004046016F
MPYDELLADRIRQSLKEKKTAFEEKKMFGGICFMVDDKMCIGIIKNDLMARIDPEQEKQFLKDTGARPMDFTHRPMKGYLYVNPEGTDLDDDLSKWVDRCLEFNPKATSSKKKKNKK